MLYFIGGAARSGKGILVRRLLAELQLPYLNLDVLKMGLTRGAPEFPIDPNAGALQVATRLWPIVREMSHSLLRDGVDYVFEGELLPHDVAALRHTHPTQVRACFLGYPTITPAEKLHAIRTHSGHPNDWPQEVTDAALLAVIHREIAFSQYLEAQCAHHAFPFFDSSRHFMPAVDAAVAYIRSTRATPPLPYSSSRPIT